MVKRVVVVGAGLSGLVCARTLQRNGFETLVAEAAEGPGGRIRTDAFEGFLIDRGFQVYFEAYPHARQEFDLNRLEMKAYRRGALIYTGLGFKNLDAQRPLPTVLNPAFGYGDMVRLGLLAGNTLLGRTGVREQPTEHFLQSAGFSDIALQRFFRPFLGGIFLDPSLSTSSSQFSFLFKMLLQGRVSTPALGIGMLTQQVADSLPNNSIHYNSTVKSVCSEGVTLGSGQTIGCDRVVLACDPPTTASLLQEPYRHGSLISTTLYFESTQPPIDEPFIALNGTGSGVVNLVAPLSVVSPQLAPPGKHLVAVTTFATASEETLIERVTEECKQSFPDRAVPAWRYLKTVTVPFAQYRQNAGFRDLTPRLETAMPNVYRGGEILTNSSIDGACEAGQLVAAEISER